MNIGSKQRKEKMKRVNTVKRHEKGIKHLTVTFDQKTIIWYDQLFTEVCPHIISPIHNGYTRNNVI